VLLQRQKNEKTLIDKVSTGTNKKELDRAILLGQMRDMYLALPVLEILQISHTFTRLGRRQYGRLSNNKGYLYI
jgi:hypothetical protein